jgi:hypothetical protein
MYDVPGISRNSGNAKRISQHGLNTYVKREIVFVVWPMHGISLVDQELSTSFFDRDKYYENIQISFSL